MRSALALILCIAAHAGVVRGIVYEHASGLPLARTIVILQPVPQPGVENKPLQTRASTSGTFVFPTVPDGLYFLRAQRDPYFPAYYGQRRPDGRGKPVEILKDTDLFAELRMYRKGAVTGRVLDENGIGMQDVPVVAYRARLPLRAAGRGIADDRGMYRIFGLEPGNYWVRTVPHTLDDGEGLLPTFGREGRQISESAAHLIRLDEDTPDADVRPFPGRLFRLRGRALCDPSPVPVFITLSSETGQKKAESRCMQTFTFEGLAPGSYEIFAQMQMENGPAGFTELQLEHGSENGDVPISPLSGVDFLIRRAGATGRANIPITILGHRQDLSDSGEDHEIPLHGSLAPGHWELTANVPPGYFVESITTPATLRREQSNPTIHSPDWFEVFIETRGYAQIVVTVSDQAVQMQGKVTSDGNAVPGAPVFLWPVAENTRRSLHGYREITADTAGNFSFDGLPPGDYRLLATFDALTIDEEKLDEARAATVHIDSATKPDANLILWIAP